MGFTLINDEDKGWEKKRALDYSPQPSFVREAHEREPRCTWRQVVMSNG